MRRACALPEALRVRTDRLRPRVVRRVADLPNQCRDLRVGRQHVAQVDGLALRIGGERLPIGIEIHTTRDREGNDQRRCHQVVGLDELVDSTGEIAVAGQHGCGDQPLPLDQLRELRHEGAGLSPAGGASIPDDLEAERAQRRHQSGGFEIARDRLRAGGKRCLHPARRLQSQPNAVASHQPGGNHHGRVGGIGARGDGRDRHRAVGGLRGFGGSIRRAADEAAVGDRERQPTSEVPAPRSDKGHAVLGARGTCDGGRGVRQVDPDDACVARHRGVGGTEQSREPRVALDERDVGRAATGRAQVLERRAIDREEAACRAVLGRHVGKGGALGNRHVRDAGAEEFDRAVDDPLLPQPLGDQERNVGGVDAWRGIAFELDSDHFGNREHVGEPKQRRLGIDAAHTPPEHAECVDHRRMRVAADDEIRERPGVAVHRRRAHDARGALEVDLVDDAGSRRMHRDAAEVRLAPAQELVALGVALALAGHVVRQRIGAAPAIDLQGMVDRRSRAARRCPHARHRRRHPRRLRVARQDPAAPARRWNRAGSRAARTRAGHRRRAAPSR